MKDEYIHTQEVKTAIDYLVQDIMENTILLNSQLNDELSNLNNQTESRITNRVISLACATSILTNIALSQISDIDTIIKNSMGK